ncbi:MAG: hypothetical protein BWY43_00350 [candidate division WS2 bacterium ADurb.Bin280]|uniref:Uncharacterized protein n=1 Tax=candidate division WS2 bacterium ADurb.Bin280 TaxID=1852829 RepID=A0A1V5SE65_9BACT|nr:MAG: hypothetical protein BWY43_00350 [candidate division WS2 bacterium ADurb.Bin280]
MKLDGRSMIVFTSENADKISTWKNLPQVICREFTNLSMKDLKSNYRLILDDLSFRKISARLQK